MLLKKWRDTVALCCIKALQPNTLLINRVREKAMFLKHDSILHFSPHPSILQFAYEHGVMFRDAPIAIILADSEFRFFVSVTCGLRYRFVPIFFLRTKIDSIYKQKYMHISTTFFLHNKINY